MIINLKDHFSFASSSCGKYRPHCPDELFEFGPSSNYAMEVCSEGALPLEADIMICAGVPGNGFTFLMVCVSTDSTGIMVLTEITKSWNVALFLLLVTLHQKLILGWIFNNI